MRRGTIALLLTVAWSAVGCVDGQRYDTQAAAELLPNGMSGPTDAPKGSCWIRKGSACSEPIGCANVASY